MDMPNCSCDKTNCHCYLVGVDGGGTKTVAAVSDCNGKVLATAKAGPSNSRNVGFEKAAQTVVATAKEALEKVSGEKQIISFVAGLASVDEEEGAIIEVIKKKLLAGEAGADFSQAKITITGDPYIAFRAGTAKKDGVVVIAGTGCVSFGWRAGKEAKTSGWGWLADEGSAYWVGQLAFRAVFNDLDGRGLETALTKAVFRGLKVKTKEELLKKVYGKDMLTVLPLLSIICDKVAQKGDLQAKTIMADAGRELAYSAITTIVKLGFGREKFPLVLAGGMFKSETLLKSFKKEMRELVSGKNLIVFKKEPVIGAIYLAREAAGPCG